MLRTIPAREHLEADEILRRQRNDRLIERLDFAARDRRAQIGLHPRARLQRNIHLRVKEAEGATARAFAVVHRDVGGVQQGVGVLVRRRGEGDADRRVHVDMSVVPGHWSSHRRHNLLDQLGEGFPIVVIRDQRDEFVAAETSGHAPRREQFVQAVSDRAEHGVTRRVPMQIIDRLESIEIQKDHGETLVARASRQGDVERLVKQPPVGESGQRVVPRGLLGQRFRGDPRGDRLAQQDRLAHGGGHRAEADATAHHHEVHQVVSDRKAAEAIEDAELHANDPGARADEHQHQELVELALSPGPAFLGRHRGAFMSNRIPAGMISRDKLTHGQTNRRCRSMLNARFSKPFQIEARAAPTAAALPFVTDRAAAAMAGDPPPYSAAIFAAPAAFSAWSRSPRMSSMCSMPIDRRT